MISFHYYLLVFGLLFSSFVKAQADVQSTEASLLYRCKQSLAVEYVDDSKGNWPNISQTAEYFKVTLDKDYLNLITGLMRHAQMLPSNVQRRHRNLINIAELTESKFRVNYFFLLVKHQKKLYLLNGRSLRMAGKSAFLDIL